MCYYVQKVGEDSQEISIVLMRLDLINVKTFSKQLKSILAAFFSNNCVWTYIRYTSPGLKGLRYLRFE